MGLGVHGGGLGVARWLLRQGIHITITDKASAEALQKPLAALQEAAAKEGAGSIHYVFGGHREEDFTNHEMIVANPAVRPDSPWIQMALQAGARVESEMTLFFRACPGPIVGITGTKGKTTTALLTGAMLRQRSPDTVVAGNLRVSALEALDRITATTPVVLELSSFQLVSLGRAGLSPTYACITNISPDHLNYHGTMEEYIQAKQQIFRYQQAGDVLVLNEAEARAGTWGTQFNGRVLTFSNQTDSQADCSVRADGMVVCGDTPLFAAREIPLRGAHNVENVLAASVLAYSSGLPPANIQTAVRQFRGVDHRLELVRELDGVAYINDTTATNPTAAVAALNSFDTPVILIAGGADKGLDNGVFPARIVERAKALILLHGSATSQLEQEVAQILQGMRVELCGTFLRVRGPYDDFAEAIRAAQQLALPGDTVLLSPGFASFGMFRNEFHRGEEFRRIVHTLESKRTD
jgi:UDP-N-acetylmuramoylalanine--D-glutamate ligase